jgi:hypothetical protein
MDLILCFLPICYVISFVFAILQESAPFPMLWKGTQYFVLILTSVLGLCVLVYVCQ